MTGVVFLDRDGTLIDSEPYPHAKSRIVLVNTAGEQLQRLCKAGFRLVVVSNQSGVGRGMISRRDVHTVQSRMLRYLKVYGVKISASFYCYHRPDEACVCRKPKPGLIEAARQHLTLPPGPQYMIGDQPSDLIAGTAAGCKSFCVGHQTNGGPSWRAVVDEILGEEGVE